MASEINQWLSDSTKERKRFPFQMIVVMRGRDPIKTTITSTMENLYECDLHKIWDSEYCD